MPDLCSELDRALQRNQDAQQAYTAAQAAMALGVTDRLERDIGIDLFGFILGETRRHEQTLRRLQHMFCAAPGRER